MTDLLKRAADALDKILPRYCEMFVALGLGDAEESVVYEPTNAVLADLRAALAQRPPEIDSHERHQIMKMASTDDVERVALSLFCQHYAPELWEHADCREKFITDARVAIAALAQTKDETAITPDNATTEEERRFRYANYWAYADDEKLVSNIDALIALDADGALVPHGLGGHARSLLIKAAARLKSLAQTPATDDAELIAVLSETSWKANEPISDTLRRWDSARHQAAARLATLRAERDAAMKQEQKWRDLCASAERVEIAETALAAAQAERDAMERRAVEALQMLFTSAESGRETLLKLAAAQAEISRLRAELENRNPD